MKKTIAILIICLSIAACGGSSKPSRSSINEHYTKVIAQYLDTFGPTLKYRFAKCATDRTYDQMSPEGLKKILTRDKWQSLLTNQGMSQEDTKALDQAVQCIDQLELEKLAGQNQK